MKNYDSIPHGEISLFHQRLQMWLDYLRANKKMLRLSHTLHVCEEHVRDNYKKKNSNAEANGVYSIETFNAHGFLCEMYMRLPKEMRGSHAPIESFFKRIVNGSLSFKGVEIQSFGYLEMDYLKGLPPYSVDDMTHLHASNTIPNSVYEWLFVSTALRHHYEKMWLKARVESLQQNGMTTPIQYWERVMRSCFDHDDCMELLARAQSEAVHV